MSSGTVPSPGMSPGDSRDAPASADISVFEALTPLVRRWRVIAASAVGCALLTAGALLLARPSYSARTTFVPETISSQGLPGSLTGLIGMAGQLGLGLNVPGAVPPEFFLTLIRSREVLHALLRTEFADSTPGGGVTTRPLVDILGIEGATLPARLQKGEEELRDRLEATLDKTTGVVTLEVRMPSSRLAAEVANRAVALVNRFNLEQRQTRSRAQRRFTGERLAEAERELREAEAAQAVFLERNRGFEQSPLLAAQAGRLARDVAVKQEQFLTLTKAHEEARIAEVRDTPVLTVIDSAVPPVEPTGPGLPMAAAVAFLAGAAAGTALVYLLAYLRRLRREQRPDYVEFREALRRRGVAGARS
ncbi:MAG TPA: GNVR domain-containing protein [Gemmatimonadales bacterium]|nr:GNVR domain-containing protein [Gemmatimonadales bacterium]